MRPAALADRFHGFGSRLAGILAWQNKSIWRSIWGRRADALSPACSMAPSCGSNKSTALTTAPSPPPAHSIGTCLGCGAISSKACGAAGAKYGRTDQKRRRRHLGRRFCAVGPRRRAAGKPAFVSRPARRWACWSCAVERVPRAEIFAQTGLQFLQINTLFHLLAMAETEVAAVGNGRVVLDDAGPVSLAADGRQVERIHQRHDDAILQSGRRALGDRIARSVGHPVALPGRDCPARHELGPAHHAPLGTKPG